MNLDETAPSQSLLRIQADVLVVEDEPDSIHELSELLTQQGHTVHRVINEAMALSAIAAEKPDLILLNLSLSGVNGYEICQQLKASEDTQDIPILFISAFGDRDNKAQAFKAGADDYITKPFQVEDLLARVKHHLLLHRQRQQLQQQNKLLQAKIREREQAFYELQQKEMALRQAEANYRSLLENSTAGIFRCTPSGQYIIINPALARIYGYRSPQEMMIRIASIGQQIYVQPKRWDELMVYLRHNGSISASESEVYRKDGTTIWVSENIWTVEDELGQVRYYEGTVQDVSDRRKMEMELRHQRQQVERLLINILPYQIAHRLQTSRQAIVADQFDEVTVLFADLVGFTAASTQISPKKLVSLLNDIFSAFDQLAERYSLEKIKTIGDEYMVAAGLPTYRPDHARAIARMALDMQHTITRFKKATGDPFQLRIGINTGPVIAGVIGIKKFAYDLWGDTVNVASRMESTGEPGRIQVAANTYKILKDQFVFEKRGLVSVKGCGEMMTYWLVRHR